MNNVCDLWRQEDLGRFDRRFCAIVAEVSCDDSKWAEATTPHTFIDVDTFWNLR
jgi:hypothetical protein